MTRINGTLAERLLKYIFRAVLEDRPDDMAFFEERIEKGVIAKLQGIVDKPFERTIAYVTGLSNVRDVIPFPRTPGNARY